MMRSSTKPLIGTVYRFTDCAKLFIPGGVAERTKAGDLKSLEGSQPSVGSNPTPSAISFLGEMR